jgi:hypothetical protein
VLTFEMTDANAEYLGVGREWELLPRRIVIVGRGETSDRYALICHGDRSHDRVAEGKFGSGRP